MTDLRARRAVDSLRDLRHVLHAHCIGRAVSRHGSDGPGRTVRAYRLRTDDGRDFLFLYGDRDEGPTARLLGPYRPDAQLAYGGGFWERVELPGRPV